MLRLTKELRKICSKPYGKLYSGSEKEVFFEIKGIIKNKLFACVGDAVSYYSLKNGLKPNILVIDGKIRREKINNKILSEIYKLTAGYKEIKVKNPPGHVTEELVCTIHRIVPMLSARKYRIFVDGEEDLSVIPLSLFMPENSIILYGQPDEGVVVLTLKKERKIGVYNIAKKMECVNNDGGKILNLFEEVMKKWNYI